MEGRHVRSSARVLRFNRDTSSYDHVFEGGASAYWPDILALKGHFDGRVFSPKELCLETSMSRMSAHRLLTALSAARRAGAARPWRIRVIEGDSMPETVVIQFPRNGLYKRGR